MMNGILFSRRMSVRVFYWTILSMTTCLSMMQLTQGQSPRLPVNAPRDFAGKTNSKNSVDLLLRSRTDCPSNLILLADLVSVPSSESPIKDLLDVSLGPAPKLGNDQSWTRSDVEKALVLRGVSKDAIRWSGAVECLVRRTQGPRVNRLDSKKTDDTNVQRNDSNSRLANVKTTLGTGKTQAPDETGNFLHPIDKSQFTAPFITPTNVSQAENLTALAIGDYLRTKTNSDGRWNIKVNMPAEHTKTFSLRNNILGVAGGQPPWDGPQQFIFRVMGKNGEQVIPIVATVKLPDMVVAAKRALSKGYVLQEADLAWIPMPRGLNYGPEDCFSRVDQLVGQQLRRAMSTQQAIRLKEVGPPTIVHVGDLVSIGIVSGAVSVETNGRAMESGAIDDLIQIEVQPHRKRVMARITGDRTAQVISNGPVNAANPARTIASKTNSNLPR